MKIDTQADSSGRCWRLEGLSKKENRLLDTNYSVVIAGGGACMEVEDGIRWVNGNGKNTMLQKQKKSFSLRIHQISTL